MTLVLPRAGLPYPAPPAGGPLRVAFVGQATFFEACSWEERSARAATAFVEFREGGDVELMRAQVAALAPHAVVCFRPEVFPAGALADVRAPVLGFLTEPIPRRGGRRPHPDLRRRAAALTRLDRDNVDRLVAFDPLIVPAADEVMDVWRSLPLPVADRFFAPVARIEGRARLLFVGRSTRHRERFLAQVKAEDDVLHVAFGMSGAELAQLLGRADVAINVHNEPYPSFENRVCLHLAAGHLVVSETLSPTHGLEPGIDYLEVASGEQLAHVARVLARFPDAYHRVRVRGRAKAESFRASAVWPRVLGDLLRDLAAFGTHRSAAA